jgi:hypothetical protein
MKYDPTLTQGQGWMLYQNFVPDNLIQNFNNRILELKPKRALNFKKQYAEDHEIQSIGPLAIWWSQQVLNWPEFQSIEKIVATFIATQMQDPILYAADVVTIQPGSNLINPHIDTPYRFPKWNFDKRLLSIQTIIPLHDIDSNSGSTGLYSGSQLKDYPINECYAGKFDQEFTENYIQPNMPCGSLLYYNAKLLHSSMPNPSTRARRALLIHYTDPTIINELYEIDNIWA